MAAVRRLQRELKEILETEPPWFKEIEAHEGNILHWVGLMLPDTQPYNQAAFKVELLFPSEYPFKPPKVLLKTPIYHPNVDEQGQVCLSIVTPENWKPATKAEQVIEALVELVNKPEPEHPLRADIANEYTKDKKKFMKNAAEHAKKHGEKRPDYA